MKSRGFTLIELLVVIGVIAVLAAIIFPVFATVRGKARQTVCLSNLRQIGMGIAQYVQDYDEISPYGVDPSDQHSIPDIWSTGPSPQSATIATMQPLQIILEPYIKSAQIWHCPADSGFDYLDHFAVANAPVALAARPTMFDKYQTSYFYRTELGLHHTLYTNLTAKDGTPASAEHGPSEINVLMDGSGAWHGSLFQERRYNTLMADGHAVNLNLSAFDRSWYLQIQ